MILKKDDIEKRRHLRYDYLSTIEYVRKNSGTSDKVYKGVTINISAVGVALYVFNHHEEGENIIIKSELPVVSHAAKIQWVKEEHNGLYRAGLMMSGNSSC